MHYKFLKKIWLPNYNETKSTINVFQKSVNCWFLYHGKFLGNSVKMIVFTRKDTKIWVRIWERAETNYENSYITTFIVSIYTRVVISFS